MTFSDVQGGFDGTGNINADPKLVHNPSPGNFGDLHIEPYSPAAGAGNVAAVPSGVTTDLGGNARFTGVTVDMGAYEVTPTLSASAGGPYFVVQGQSLTLHGLGSSDAAGSLTYGWSFNGDSSFTDASGPDPQFLLTDFAVGTEVPVSLQVKDSGANTIISSTTVIIEPAVLDVDSHATGNDNGSSWANAFTNLTSALNAAVAGQTIDVAQGTYTPTTGTDRTATFQLKSGVAIDGGFAGVLSSTPGVRDVLDFPTILSGDIGTMGDNSDNSFHVVIGSGTDSTAVLNGVTIAGGNADGSSNVNSGSGAAMFNSGGSPTINDCTFTGNGAVNGGAIYDTNFSAPKFTACTFTGNNASAGFGGAMFNFDASSPTLINCLFSGNVSASGDAIYDSVSSAMIDDCTIVGDSSSQDGTVVSSSSSQTITNSIIWGNDPIELDSNSSATVTFSDIQGGFTGDGNIDADPMFVDAATGDFALQPDSPCVDVGSNAAVPAGITTDLVGDRASSITSWTSGRWNTRTVFSRRLLWRSSPSRRA